MMQEDWSRRVPPPPPRSPAEYGWVAPQRHPQSYPSHGHPPPPVQRVVVERSDNSVMATIATVVTCLLMLPALGVAVFIVGMIADYPGWILLLTTLCGPPLAVGFGVPGIYKWFRRQMR